MGNAEVECDWDPTRGHGEAQKLYFVLPTPHSAFEEDKDSYMSHVGTLLSELASARSGDKGNHANIGVVAGSPEAYRILEKHLTADVVRDYFQSLRPSAVQRFELPKVWALNFLLYDVLGGGASLSLRIDTQGKLLGTEILNLRLPIQG